MLNLDLIKKIDQSGMYRVYEEWPKIAKESYNLELEKVEFQNINQIVFAGMGGSGSIGDIFTSILSKTNIHTSTVKGYLLPKTMDENSLLVVTSVSGNTDEAIHILKNSELKKYKIICFSSGGKIEEICKNKKIFHYKIPEIHSPRASFTKYLYSMINVLEPNIPVRREEILESISNMEKLQKNISILNLNDSNPSYSLAKWITKIPLIYYPWGLQSCVIRFKNSLQENSKMHAITEDIIEASHNGVVAWEHKSNLQPILVEGKDDFIKTKERWRIIKKLFSNNGIEFKEIKTQGDSILSKITYLIYLFDYCSIYKSVMLKRDPTPVESIKFIKKNLNKFSTDLNTHF